MKTCTTRLCLVALSTLFGCRAPDAEGILLPTAIAQAQTTGVEIHGALEIHSRAYDHTFAQVTAAADHTLALPFEGVPVGTYTFTVHVTGKVGGQELALLDYTQINVNVGNGSGNEWTAVGGTWSIATPAGQPADADGDGMSDFDELVYGLNPIGRFSTLATPPSGEAIVGLAGTDPRFLLYATTSHVTYLGNQDLPSLTDPLVNPVDVLPKPQSPLALEGGTCSGASLSGIAVSLDRAVIAATSGCLFTVNASAAALTLPVTTTLSLAGHTTTLELPPASAVPVTFDWQKVAVSADPRSASRWPWPISLIGNGGTQSVLYSLGESPGAEVALTTAASGTPAYMPPTQDIALTDALTGCGSAGIATRLFADVEHITVDYAPSMDLTNLRTLRALASRLDVGASSSRCELYGVGSDSSSPDTVLIAKAICDTPATVDLSSCRIFTPDASSVAGPLAAAIPTAIAFGKTAAVRDPASGTPVEAMFLADSSGQIFYSTDIVTGSAAPSWQTLGSVPDGLAVVSLVAPAVADSATVPAIFIATSHHIYRVP